MQAANICIPCIMRQAYTTAMRATDDEQAIRRILDETADYVRTIELDGAPADLSNYIYHLTREITGNDDPYKHDKQQSNEQALSLLPGLREKIADSDDPLEAAVRLAILGNLIDLGIDHSLDMETAMKTVFDDPFAIDDYPAFKKDVIDGERKSVLYVADNAGEIVFDRLLIEQLIRMHDVTLSVKNGPVINDATMDDAEAAGLTGMVNVIDTGSNGIGVYWKKASSTFKETFTSADIVISKGQGNFETIDGRPGLIYFMLRAKCDHVAKTLGVRFGDIILKRSYQDD